MVMNKVTVTLLFTLASLSAAQTAAPSPVQFSGLPQLVKANQWHNAGGLQSFVSPEAVVFKFPGSNQKAVALPARQRFVVIALNALHVQVPKRTVQDLRQRSVLVKIQAGKTVINKTAKTLHNGFLELWLDCNQT